MDVILNHIAAPCSAALSAGYAAVMPCVGWAGSNYGNRRINSEARSLQAVVRMDKLFPQAVSTTVDGLFDGLPKLNKNNSSFAQGAREEDKQREGPY